MQQIISTKILYEVQKWILKLKLEWMEMLSAWETVAVDC